MIPFILAAIWPPFAAGSLWPRSGRAAVLAGGAAGVLSMAVFLAGGYLPAAAMSAMWVATAVASWVMLRPPRPSRAEQRQLLVQRQTVMAEALEELESTDHLVPLVKNAPRRVA